MVQCMIRLQNHGKRNHPYWWIVIQGKNKAHKGRIIERVGIWAPRKTKTVDRSIMVNTYKLKYWLGVGATPTDKVHHLLATAGLLPHKPIPFGSKSVYPQKKKTYPLEYFHKHRWNLNVPEFQNLFYYEKIKNMEKILQKKLDLDTEALNDIVRPRDLKSKYNSNNEYNDEMNTDDINSDDLDFYARKRNFEIISQKLKKYFETKYALYKGNDYAYNNYIRKLEKLSKHESLDAEGFKDYLEGVKKLTESDSIFNQKLGEFYLKELETKKLLDLELTSINDGKSTTNESNFSEMFKNSSSRDVKDIIKALENGFENSARKLYKLIPDQSLTDNAFQDLKFLRMQKFLIKLRHELTKKPTDKDQISQVKNSSETNTNNFFTSLFEDMKNDINIFTPVEDANILQEFTKEEVDSYEDLIFQDINKYLMSTKTISKYSQLLFNPELQDTEGADKSLTKKLNASLKIDPNIYLTNSAIIDELMNACIARLNKSYEVNEVYKDEEIDLAAFDAEEMLRTSRRQDMEERLKQMKNKYGDFSIIYDDYAHPSEELKERLRKFKEEYKPELEAELDIKFKKIFKKIKEVRNKMKPHKFESQEDFDKDKQEQEMIEKVFEKVKNEFELLKQGKDPNLAGNQTKEQEQPSDSERFWELYARHIFSQTMLGVHKNPELDFLFPIIDESNPAIVPSVVMKLKKKKYKKSPNPEFQDDIIRFNRSRQRYNELLIESAILSKGVSKETKLKMKERFTELFGSYSSLMYPDGYRHYENYESYRAVFPTRTISEYQSELYMFCDFDKFVSIVYGSINHIRKLCLMAFEFPEIYDKLVYLPIYLRSKDPNFINVELKKKYEELLSQFEKKNTKFKILEALEVCSSNNLALSILPDLEKMLNEDLTNKLKQRLIFNQYTLSKFPSFEKRGEDLNLNRQSPFMSINPLKAHRANPVDNQPISNYKKDKVFITNAELGHRVKNRGRKYYSTMIAYKH